MLGNAGPWLIDQTIALVLNQPCYAGLHNGTVNPANPTANEISATRQRVTWVAQGGLSLVNSNLLVWGGLPEAFIHGAAVYTTPTGASLVMWCPVPNNVPVSIASGGSYRIAIHDLYFQIQ